MERNGGRSLRLITECVGDGRRPILASLPKMLGGPIRAFPLQENRVTITSMHMGERAMSTMDAFVTANYP